MTAPIHITSIEEWPAIPAAVDRRADEIKARQVAPTQSFEERHAPVRAEGRLAALALDARGTCPYSYGSTDRHEWMVGYEAGQGERRPIDEAAPPESAAALPAPVRQTRPIHPAASLFPMMSEAEMAELAADIETHGLREPIWEMPDHAILDGRNRFAACGLAGIKPRFRVYAGDDPVGFVVSLNLKRRHLSESQRALIAAKLATMPQGARTDLSAIAEKSQGQAATLLNVSADSVGRAKAVLKDGAPDLVAAVERGAVSVAAAAAIAAELPAAEQSLLVARGEAEILRQARDIRARKAEARRAEKFATIGELALASANLPSLAEIGLKQRYAVLLADPPWRFEDPPVGNTDRSVENHYPTLTLEQLKALPVAAVATTTAVLYCWTTNPMLAEALALIAAWGFQYKANLAWDKEVAGLGYWARNRHELLLIASRGPMPAPPEAVRPESVYRMRRAGHSAKPPAIHGIIERCFPDLPRLELFGRARRAGWDHWGNQALRLGDSLGPSDAERAPSGALGSASLTPRAAAMAGGAPRREPAA